MTVILAVHLHLFLDINCNTCTYCCFFISVAARMYVCVGEAYLDKDLWCLVCVLSRLVYTLSKERSKNCLNCSFC